MDGDKPIIFNKDAKVWKPKTQKTEELSDIKNGIENIDIKTKTNNDNVLYNLNATEFKPKQYVEYVEDDGDVDEDEIDQEFDQTDKQLIDELVKKEQIFNDEMSDEDNWFPKYQDCNCCKGFIYKCEGEVCNSLGACFCKSQDDYDNDDI